MTTRFRLDAVELDTAEGVVRHLFPSDLTVLAGPTGVGKTTLLELIKYGFGGYGVLADVARDHVRDVSLEVSISDARLRLSRSLDPSKRTVVRVTDLITQDRLPDHDIDEGEPNLNTLLLDLLGMADDLRAAARSGTSTRAGGRITFRDVLTYLYVPQALINRDIAHSQESYRDPTRRAVFEIFFGLTDPDVLRMRSQINLLNGQIAKSEAEYKAVLSFLHDSQTTGRLEAEIALQAALEAQRSAEVEQERLRSEIGPVTDRVTQVLRDLLGEAERGLSDARDASTELVRRHGEYTGERRRVERERSRLQRMYDANERLADIEFVVCPRCMQSIRDRTIPADACRLCLQADPISTANLRANEQYEMVQLREQLEEADDQLVLIDRQLATTADAISDREELIKRLSSDIEARTADRITPRLQAFSDATDRLATAVAEQSHLEIVLRQWDRVDDLERVVSSTRSKQSRLKLDADRASQALENRRSQLLGALDVEFRDAVTALGIPGVQSAGIDHEKYLPMLNGQPFTTFSPPGGGIFTATQVAYWTTLLTVALRDRQSLYPAFLLLDSPRLALNNAEELSRALYRRLVTLADASRGRLQIIIADNELPAEYRRSYSEIDFSYEHPTVSTVRHPGPAAVETLEVAEID